MLRTTRAAWPAPLLASALALLFVALLAARPADAGERLEKLLTESFADTLIGRYADAVDTLEILQGASDDPAFDRRVGRLLDRARRALRFEDRLAVLLQDNPVRGRVELHLLGGDFGDYVRSDGRSLWVRFSRDGRDVVEEAVEARKLAPASVVALSAPLALSCEDALGRACVALSEKDHRTFDACAARAVADAKLKGAVDSAIAYDREIDPVPPGGFVRVGDGWKSGAELAVKAEIGDPRALFAKLHSAKPAEADAARAKLDELLRANPDGVRGWALARRDELRAAFERAPEQKTVAALRERVGKLKKARDEALQLIFDEQRYFYPYRPPECPAEKAAQYAEVEAEVDRLVAAVRELWGDEAGPPPEPVVRAPAFLATVAELHELRARLLELGVARDATDRALDPCWMLRAGEAISIRDVAGDSYDAARFARDAPVAFSNATVRPQKGGPSADELREFALTNAYRSMFGRRQLLWNGKLCACARGHSEWMERTGTFAHFEEEGSPRFDPSGRAKLAGYPSGASENILFGDTDPARAHAGWIRSSGHHRNILLAEHTELGVARSGTYWTQNFGGSLEYKGNLVRPSR